MITNIHPKLPMRNKVVTRDFYCNLLEFEIYGSEHFEGYLMLQKDAIQIHFFEHKNLVPEENYGQVYIRTNEIENLYAQLISKGVKIHPNGNLELKHWGIKEFSILDPDNNLLTFGENVL